MGDLAERQGEPVSAEAFLKDCEAHPGEARSLQCVHGGYVIWEVEWIAQTDGSYVYRQIVGGIVPDRACALEGIARGLEATKGGGQDDAPGQDGAPE